MNYENLPPDYKNTFSRYTKLLGFIGLEFFNDFDKSKIRLFTFNIIFLPFIYGQFSLMAKITAENFLLGAHIVPVSVMFALDVIKMTTALVKKSEIKALLLEIGELWPKEPMTGDGEKAVILKNWLKNIGILLNDLEYISPSEKYLQEIRSQSVLFYLLIIFASFFTAFYIYALVNLAMFEVIPLLTTCYNFYAGIDEYMFPFQHGLWEVDSTTSYLFTYLWELISTIPCQLCLYLPYDLLIVTMTSNVSILLRLLQVDLANAVRTCSDRGKLKINLHISDPDSYKIIFRIVRDHQKLLRIAQQLNNIFGLVIFIHVAFSSVVICFFGFLTMVFGGLAETIANLLTVWSAIITIFLIALSGQLLSDTSSNVAHAAYQSLWYESDKRVKRLILIIIIRSQRTSYLSALGFSDMTLRSFSKIMSTAWTYFSLLIQVYEEK